MYKIVKFALFLAVFAALVWVGGYDFNYRSPGIAVVAAFGVWLAWALSTIESI